MTDETAKLDAILSLLVASKIPVEHQLWDAGMIATYLGCSKQQVVTRFAPLPNFPRAARIRTADGGRAHPRWRAREVMEWAESHFSRAA